jgi:membrane-associated phospholipid phosphatase
MGELQTTGRAAGGTSGNPGSRGPGWRWAGLAILLGLLLWPLDAFLLRALSGVLIDSELEVALRSAQQFGDLFAILVTALLIWQLDPARRRRLADLVAAAALVAAACLALKMAVARPRPEFGTPAVFVGPFRSYEVPHRGKLHAVYSWQVHRQLSARLWSMPSSHTALAVVLGVFLTVLYPKLFWFCLVMVGLVAFGRVHFGEHYPTDALVGAVMAYGIGGWVVRQRRGGALLERWGGGGQTEGKAGE